MEPTTVLSLTGTFLKLVGDTLDAVKRQELADVDAAWLRLKREQLSEKLDEYKADLDAAVKRDKAKVQQEHVSRGLGGSTVLQSAFRVIK